MLHPQVDSLNCRDVLLFHRDGAYQVEGDGEGVQGIYQ